MLRLDAEGRVAEVAFEGPDGTPAELRWEEAAAAPSRVPKAFSKLELRMPQHRVNETPVRPQTQTS